LLIAAYLVEAGLVLTMTPWMTFWERNYFAQAWPWLGALMESPYVRGAVTGVGLVTAVSGLRDLGSVIFGRRAGEISAADGKPPQP
jgi:hypothetical protein